MRSACGFASVRVVVCIAASTFSFLTHQSSLFLPPECLGRDGGLTHGAGAAGRVEEGVCLAGCVGFDRECLALTEAVI